jgi:hypothetical protein
VSVTVAVVGMKVTVMEQVAAGASVAQLVMEEKFCVVLVGVAIWSMAVPVLVRVMACCVAVGPGTLLKMSEVGLKARPGSGVPKPVSAAVMGPVVVWSVTAPVRWPVVVGANAALKKQEALGASVPLQGWPPVGAVLRAKSPEVVRLAMETAVVVRFVSVKSTGALMLWTGTEPKSCVSGLRMRPVSARPVPVRVSGAGVPEVLEESVTDAVWGPGAEGVNCTPSQQLVHEPVKVLRKAEVGGWPWPKPVSSTRDVCRAARGRRR